MSINKHSYYRVPPNVPQLISQKVLNEQCGENGDGGGKICVIMFVPHIYDSNSKQRQIYIDNLVKIAANFRGTFSFLWSEGGANQVLLFFLKLFLKKQI